MGRLAGKVALISGAARGQGAAEARLFAQEGASVVLGDIRSELGEQVAAEITAAGGEALFTPLDVSSESDWARAVELAESTYGKLDILVNNAGDHRPRGHHGHVHRAVEPRARRQPDGHVPRHARRDPRDAPAPGGGSIVNISSVLATMGSGNSASYTATKGAVSALTRTVSVELATEGIRVNAVHPGGVETPMAVECLGDDAELRRALVATHPMGRIGEPGEIATGVLFLASDEASFVTGASLVIDGGNTVW